MTNRPMFSASLIGALIAATISVSAGPAYAEHVNLGKHTKADIQSHCDAAGGTMIEGSGGKGYGCFNQNNNTAVTCNDQHECGGWVPNKP